MSNVSIENWKNEAYRDGQVKRLKAYRHSEDSRKKIGDRHRGKTNSEESRKKNSISSVSPNILYFPPSYAIICVFAPLAYSKIGSSLSILNANAVIK